VLEKARVFDPFGRAGLTPLGEIRLTLAGEIKMRGCVVIKVYGAAFFFLSFEVSIFLRRPIFGDFSKIS